MHRLAAVAVSAVALLATASSAATPTGVVPGVHLLPGIFTPGSQPDGNTVILDAPDGLVVVDTGRHAAHAQAIVDYATSAGRPIVAVVNTHWHLDHIGGNAAVRAAHPAVRVHASGALDAALGGFLANYRKQLEGMLATKLDPKQKEALEAEVRLVDAGAKLGPDVVIEHAGTRSIGGRAFRIGLEANAVTAGDVWLFDEARGVLVAGDLVTLPAPFLDTACPAKWKDALDRLAAIDFELMIPGHGAPLTKRQFDVYRSAFGGLLGCAAGDAETDRCVAGWIAAAAPLGVEDGEFTRAMMGYYVDLLRDPERARANCD